MRSNPRLLVAGAVVVCAGIAIACGLPGANPAPPDAGEAGAPGASWLNLLPDGETKRSFILDCTGCHGFDRQIARGAQGRRSARDWETAIGRMLRYAGPKSGFPVMSIRTDSTRLASWLEANLDRPDPKPVPLPRSRRVVEFPLEPAFELPHDVAVDGAGKVVITGMFTGQMMVLDPASGKVDTIGIPVERANPRAVEIDERGRWWVVLGGPQRIARYDPADRTWVSWPVGMYAHSLGIAPDGRVWFNGHFTVAPALIGCLDPESGTISTFEIPEDSARAAKGPPVPYELRVGADGRVWVSELQGNRIIRFDPRTRAFAAWEMPLALAGPRRFDIAADGTLWIPAYSANLLVRFDPAGGRFERFPLPIGDTLPYVARVEASSGRVWVGTSAADAVYEFDPGTRRFVTHPLPSRGALVRHLAFDPRSGDVWLAYGASPGPLSARVARLARGR